MAKIKPTSMGGSPGDLALAAIVLLALICSSCVGLTSSKIPSVPPSVTVSVNPTSVTLSTGASQQFTATVQNTTNTNVTWQVNGTTGGDATHGTISTTGLYTAPASVPSPATVTVTAVSQADTTKSASAAVTITATPPAISVFVSPTSANVQVGQTQQFTATVTGSSNTNVSWSVNGVPGGNGTVGTISSGGLYTAPAGVPSPATVTVRATSVADPTKSASASVTISASGQISVSVNPTSATVSTGATQQFTATVTGSSNTNVTWSVNGIVGGNSTVGTITASSPGVPSPGPGDTIVFQDSFESGGLTNWDDLGANPSRYTIDTTHVHTGTHSLQVLFSPTISTGGLTKWFMPGYDEIFVRFYIWYDTNFSLPQGMHFLKSAGNQTGNRFSSSGQAGICPNGTDYFYAGVDPVYTSGLTPFQYYTYWPDMNPAGGCFGNFFTQTNPLPVTSGAWHEIVFHGKTNTIGNLDGMQELWQDGQKILSQTGMRWRNSTILEWNEFSFQNYTTSAPSTTIFLWIDDVTIWTPGASSSGGGFYTAPAAVPSPPTVTVTATSVADPTKSASATVTITLPSISVSVAPSSVTVQPSQTQQFVATVQGTSSTAVTWQVNGVTGGDSTHGTISSGGLYTAPAAVPSPATITVTATSVADQSKSASATVTITSTLPASILAAGFETAADRACPPTTDGVTCANPGTWSYVSDGNPPKASYINDPVGAHSGSWYAQMTIAPPPEKQFNMYWLFLKNLPLNGWYAKAWWKFPVGWKWGAGESAGQKLFAWESAGTTRMQFTCSGDALGSTQDPTNAYLLFWSSAISQQWRFNQPGPEIYLKADGQWHSVEVYIQQTTGTIQAWLDGHLYMSYTGVAMGQDPINATKFGAYLNGPNIAGNVFYMDDLGISTSFIP